MVVLGAGLAGSAFCVPLADQGHDVSLVGTHVDGPTIEALAPELARLVALLPDQTL